MSSLLDEATIETVFNEIPLLEESPKSHETIYGKFVGVTYHYTSKKWISKVELLGDLYSIGKLNLLYNS